MPQTPLSYAMQRAARPLASCAVPKWPLQQRRHLGRQPPPDASTPIPADFLQHYPTSLKTTRTYKRVAWDEDVRRNRIQHSRLVKYYFLWRRKKPDIDLSPKPTNPNDVGQDSQYPQYPPPAKTMTASYFSDPPAKLAKTYQISDLVLNLDAEDCPGVRPYNDSDEREQRKIWARNEGAEQLWRRIRELREATTEAMLRSSFTPSPLDARRLTERDVLATALLGVTADKAPMFIADEQQDGSIVNDSSRLASQPPFGDIRASRLYGIGILRQVAEDTDHTVQLMLHRLEKQTPEQPVAASVLGDRLKSLSFPGARRLVVPLLQTDWGRRQVADVAQILVDACTSNLPRYSDEYAWRVHHFIRDVSTGLASRGIEIELSKNSRKTLLMLERRASRFRGSSQTAGGDAEALSAGGYREDETKT